MSKRDYKIKEYWVGPYDKEPSCQYCRGVGCDDPSHCAVCGWNPFVSLQRITEKYGQECVDALTLFRGRNR
jgi:hypothetical protein